MQLNLPEIQKIIDHALTEDVGAGDITGRLLIPEDKRARLLFVNRDPLIVCGTEVVKLVFSALNNEIETKVLVAEGERAEKGSKLIEVSGPARDILTGERTALNLFQRMCAVATYTNRFVRAIEGTKTKILDTRKTMPGLRVSDKYAVTVGGGTNHRMRLDDGILIKDNHIALAGGVKQAMALAKKGNRDGLMIEIECDTLAQVREALEAGADVILLDNMQPAMILDAVMLVSGRAKLEASGNVSLESVRAIAETGVDFISIGRITHSVPGVDIGLDITIL